VSFELFAHVLCAVGVLEPNSGAVEGEAPWRKTQLFLAIEALAVDGDSAASRFLGHLRGDDPPFRAMHALGQDLACRLEIQWPGARELAEEQLSSSVVVQLLLAQLARAGLLEFAYALDSEGQPVWQLTDLFDAIETALRFGDFTAQVSTVEEVDSPEVTRHVMSRGRILGDHYSAPWAVVEPGALDPTAGDE
jgi:hypothetical protein